MNLLFELSVILAVVVVSAFTTFPSPTSDLLTVTFPERACQFTVVVFSTLSVLRLEKFVFTCHLKDAPVIQSFNVVIVDIVLRYYTGGINGSASISCIIP